LGLDGKGAGNRDPLGLAAGQLMGVPRPKTGGEGDHAEQLVDPGPPLCPARDEMVDCQDLAQSRRDREARVQGRKGILENELNLASEHAPAGCPVDRTAHELDAPRSWVLEAHQQPAKG
jgi:hypothetical protein